MEHTEQVERIAHFLRRTIIGELGQLQGRGLSVVHFVLMGQAIEVLGAFLDNKPFKARDQSAIRFGRSINRLFGGGYRLLNDRNGLYDKLRNQLTHTFSPGSGLVLLNRAENSAGWRHLEVREGKIVLIAEVLYEDICRAAERLLEAIEKGSVKPKYIPGSCCSKRESY